ncbi:hypothetical protein SRABI89_05552 [Pseudomonas koreensis]|nr:hypothetical protein SRABI89_05552 [Pseudomonas koreensis]
MTEIAHVPRDIGRRVGVVEHDPRDAVARVAEARGVSRARIALAWVAQQTAVTAPIVGATRTAHIDDAVAAADIRLEPDEITALESAYTPREPEGF